MIPAGLRRWLEGGRPGIKVCGITREEDALAAITAGIDALGFNFYPESKRHIPLAELTGWIGCLPEEVGRIAVVVNADENLLQRLRGSGLFHAIQFHGDETPAFCAEHGGEFYIKAGPLSDQVSADAAAGDPAPCLLLDAHAPGVFGGPGRVIDWSLAAQVAGRRSIVLSGGLHPGNVAAAVARVAPTAVDTASGVESSPGIKDPVKMRDFVAALRGA
jgi:phosphoribosylanthranilate isomerase